MLKYLILWIIQIFGPLVELKCFSVVLVTNKIIFLETLKAYY